MLRALVREVSPTIGRGELTHLSRRPIDVAAARAQHAAYVALLEQLGARVETIEALPEASDAVFVEDCAVVIDEVACVAPSNAASRAPERDSVAATLSAFRRVVRLEPPATLDGGDVMQVGRTLFVGLSARTNEQAIAALEEVVAPLGYRVVAAPVSGCLHLKTACTFLGDNRILANPAWLDTTVFADYEIIPVPQAEPLGANTLTIGSTIVPAAHRETAALLEQLGLTVRPVDVSELQKAEAGVTCMSLLFEDGRR